MSEASPSQPVGKILVLTGSAVAESTLGQRVLEKDSPVYQNDIIKTDQGSQLQIKFNDDTQVSQGESSSLSIDSFIYNSDQADNSNLLLNMMKGTFRTISGEIVKDSPTKFMLKSPQSTIGIRGTIVVSQVTDLYEKHGVEQLAPGKILVITDSYGNIRILKVPLQILDFYAGQPVGEIRQMLLDELNEFQTNAPLIDDKDGDTPLGYTPPDDFVSQLDAGVNILEADIIPSDFGVSGNMIVFSGTGTGLLGVFNSLADIPGYDPNRNTDLGRTQDDNDNVFPDDDDSTEESIEYQVTPVEAEKGEDPSAPDGITEFTFTITRTGDTTGPDTVDWAVTGSGSNPADADDFGGTFPSGSVIFEAGVLSQQITIQVVSDAVVENDEFFTVTLTYTDENGDPATASSPAVILADAIEPIEYAVSPVEALKEEDASQPDGITEFTFTITRTGDTTGPDTVDWEVSGSGINPADADDFGGTFPSGSVMFEDGQTSQDIIIQVVNDTQFENDEFFTVTLTYTDENGDPATASSQAVIVGDTIAFASLSLDELDGSNGFKLVGEEPGDFSGSSVSNAGDVNDDGFDDVIIGSPQNFGNEDSDLSYPGLSHVVFGGRNFSDGIVDLDTIDQGDDPAGFKVIGIDDGDQSGFSVSNAGDVNNDGISDILISSPFSSNSDHILNGESYIVYGGQAFSDGPIDLNLIGAGGFNGFRIRGADSVDESGYSVSSAGDINGDGIADLIIGAPNSNGSGNDFSLAGDAFIVFGGQDFSSGVLDLGQLNADEYPKGFKIAGFEENQFLGYNVDTAGDVNGDGLDDIIVSAIGFNSFAGESYVIFGGQTFSDDTINLNTLGQTGETQGFKLTGINPGDQSGFDVTGAGDINGDGLDDLIIGAHLAGSGAGETYVVFGQNTFDPDFDLTSLDGTNGFTLNGIDAEDRSGSSVAGIGDYNGDGYGDFIIGAPRADIGENISAGEAYVVFGKAIWSENFDLSGLNGLNGFTLTGVDIGDNTGTSVSVAGDVNGDGYADLIIGAPGAAEGETPGESYVVYGNNHTGSTTHLGTSDDDTLTGTGDANNIIGGTGDDTLIGNGGFDVLYGGAGDDDIFIGDASFFRVDGGSGLDTLFLDSQSLDLTAISDNAIQGIEHIDMTPDSTSDPEDLRTLTLNVNDILNMNENSNELFIDGNIQNSVTVTDGNWEYFGSREEEGYHTFKDENTEAELHIDTRIADLGGNLPDPIEYDTLTNDFAIT